MGKIEIIKAVTDQIRTLEMRLRALSPTGNLQENIRLLKVSCTNDVTNPIRLLQVREENSHYLQFENVKKNFFVCLFLFSNGIPVNCKVATIIEHTTSICATMQFDVK